MCEFIYIIINIALPLNWELARYQNILRKLSCQQTVSNLPTEYLLKNVQFIHKITANHSQQDKKKNKSESS